MKLNVIEHIIILLALICIINANKIVKEAFHDS
jgi:hypothetical protein